jgi:large subunit ribosomal protein L22
MSIVSINKRAYEENIAAKAFLMNAHISPRKISLVVDEIRNKSVMAARHLLIYSKTKSASLLLKLLNSAVSNAVNNHNYDKNNVENLIISHIWVGKGMVLKRIEQRARGSSNRLLKRYSNVSLFLQDKDFLPVKTPKRKLKKDKNINNISEDK